MHPGHRLYRLEVPLTRSKWQQDFKVCFNTARSCLRNSMLTLSSADVCKVLREAPVHKVICRHSGTSLLNQVVLCALICIIHQQNTWSLRRASKTSTSSCVAAGCLAAAACLLQVTAANRLPCDHIASTIASPARDNRSTLDQTDVQFLMCMSIE